MSSEIGRGTWIDKAADALVRRERSLGRSTDLIVTESGLGASGIPHVGSLADAVRSYAVALALRDMGFRSEAVAFSDDMDGLRKVPAGMPAGLEEHLLKPVCFIPDPFDCHESYGAHNSWLLRDALDRCDIEYAHRSGYETYESGKLAPYIDKILRSWESIGAKIEELTGQTKFTRVLPYYPLCEECGRIYTAEANSYDSEAQEVSYVCTGVTIRRKAVKGCGHVGSVGIDGAGGKLSWKVEFAARWALQDVRFEAYGKDIADSVRVNDWVSREVLGFEPPMHLRYEMFLDATGGKISKSEGNVFTPQVWLRYASPKSLILYMLRRFKGTRRLTLSTTQATMLQLERLTDVYFGRERIENPRKRSKMRGLLEYVYGLGGVKEDEISYSLVLSLAEVAPRERREAFVHSRLLSYGFSEADVQDSRGKIRYASRWIEDVRGRVSRRSIKLSEKMRKAVEVFASEVEGAPSADEIQNLVFETARKNQLDTRRFFEVLYRLVLGRSEGPRMGPLIMDLGRKQVAQKLMDRVKAGS